MMGGTTTIPVVAAIPQPRFTVVVMAAVV